MSVQPSIRFDASRLAGNLRQMDGRMNRALAGVVRFWDVRIESGMKRDAPWTDRTGNARSGLAATAFSEGNNHGIDLYGSVDYQIWLEVKNSGRYAIIGPSLRVYAPRVMATASKILDRLGSVGGGGVA